MYYFATDPIWISLYMRKISFSFLSVHISAVKRSTEQRQNKKLPVRSSSGSHRDRGPWRRLQSRSDRSTCRVRMWIFPCRFNLCDFFHCLFVYICMHIAQLMETSEKIPLDNHKILTYIEYRAVSGVFRTIDPPPLSTPRECVLPPHQRYCTHSPGSEGVGGQYFGNCQTLDWPLQYNPSTR